MVEQAPVQHVWTAGGATDKRRRMSTAFRRVNSGKLVCGAPYVPGMEVIAREAGEASLRLPHWRAQLCPLCAAGLERELDRRPASV